MTITVPTGAGNVTTASSTSASSLVISKPTNLADGDTLYAVMRFNNAGALTPPAGWTMPVNDTSGWNFAVLYKYIASAAAESATSYTFAAAGGASRTAGAIGRITGLAATGTLDSTGTASVHTGTTAVVAPATTAVSGAALLMFFGMNNLTSTGAGGSVLAVPSGMTSAATASTDNGASTSNVAVAYQQLSTSGTTGTRTSAMSPTAGSSEAVLLTFAAPAGANAVPTVAAGAAQTVSGTTATLSGSANDSDGTVTSAVWSLQSTTAASTPSVGITSNTGSGTANITATASVTGLAAGSHVFLLTATDNSGATSAGTVTIYVPASMVGPNRVISNAGAWVAVNAASLQTAVNKSAIDDTSYIETPATPSGASIVFGVDPISAGDETVPFRARYTGTGTFTVTPKLYTGSTLVTTASTPITLTGSFANYVLTLSSSENAAVANKNDVRIELVATQS